MAELDQKHNFCWIKLMLWLRSGDEYPKVIRRVPYGDSSKTKIFIG